MFEQYDEYFATLKIDKSDHTVQSYRGNLNTFINYFNIQLVDDINKLTKSDMQSYLNVLATKPTAKNSDTAKSSANANYRVVKAFINWLYTNKHITNLSMIETYRFKEAKKIATIFTKEERDRIILATKKNSGLQMMMAVLFYTGLRREEASNVLISDIQNGILKVHGKGNKERELSLTPFVMDIINKNLAKRKFESNYLFISMRGGHRLHPAAIQERVKTACKMAGIDEEKIKHIGSHSVRRSFACFLLLDGWSTFAISKALGHSSILVTERYVEPAKSLAATKAMMGQLPPEWYTEDED
jgi:integrase/recombinase XerC